MDTNNNPTNFSLKDYLHNNAVDRINDHLDDQMAKNAQQAKSISYALVNNLSQQIALPALIPLSYDVYEKSKPSLTKTSYSFPAFLNAGKIKSWHYIPSKITSKEYLTESVFLLPFFGSSVGFVANPKQREEINYTLEMLALKAIASLPAGLVDVVLIDKDGQGGNFPNFVAFHDKIKTSNVYTDEEDIADGLLALNNKMKNISQSIRAQGFDNIEHYNKNTDEISQSYTFVCISNFPHGFTKRASESLLALLDSGSTSGIYVFMTIAFDQVQGFKQQISTSGLQLESFVKNMFLFEYENKHNEATRKGYLKHNIRLLKTPFRNDDDIKNFYNSKNYIEFEDYDANVANQIIMDMNKVIQTINRNPNINILKTIPKQLWTRDSSAGINAPFAKSGIEDIDISLGINRENVSEPTHHGIIAGATGSGKTVALHDMILQFSMGYPPEDLDFWLLDYKEGTEFAIYKDFPYIKILSMQSEIEFGHDVLQKAEDTIRERGEQFKELGANNLVAYNNISKEKNLSLPDDEKIKKLPRILIIIDEFQALFPAQSTQISAKSNRLIDLILRQGRSFGIHLILATQTLKGVDINAELMSNLSLRIALKMDDKDINRIFAESNNAPKFLKDAGEGIYNKNYGKTNSNVPFQAYFAPEDAIKEITAMLNKKIIDERGMKRFNEMKKECFLYSGDFAGCVENNVALKEKFDKKEETEGLKVYIGESAGLSREHVSLTFEKRFAENLVVVGTETDKAISIFYYLIKQLSLSNKKPKIYAGNFLADCAESFENLVKDISLYNSSIKYFNNSSFEEIVSEIYNIMEERELIYKENSIKLREVGHIFLFSFFIENARDLSGQNSYGSGTNDVIRKYKEIINRGGELGIHVVAHISQFTAISEVGLSSEMPTKFAKRIGFKGGSGINLFNRDHPNTRFSASEFVSIVQTGVIGATPIKFKPYYKKGLIYKESQNGN